MADSCCQLVGDLNLGIDGCIISVSTNSSTEIINACGDEPLEGPSIMTVNLTAYASFDLWVGCPSRAGVSIPFTRKYDCSTDTTYFIFSGKGQSFSTGEASRYVRILNVMETTTQSLSASSTSGPASIYTLTTQYNGYGLSYDGNPISFETTAKGTEISLGGTLAGTYYLQNFSFEAQSGQFPLVTYTLVRPLGGNN